MTRNRFSACVFVAVASLAACSGTGEVEYAGEVVVTSPHLVAVSPGLQVVEDANEPLFYANGHYWLYRDDLWLRSDSYRGGFARVDYVTVPQEFRVIEQPQIYAHYRQNSTRYRAAYARDRRMQTRSPDAPRPMPQTPPQPPPVPHPMPDDEEPLPPPVNDEQPVRTPAGGPLDLPPAPPVPHVVKPTAPQPSTQQPTHEPFQSSSPTPPVDHSRAGR